LTVERGDADQADRQHDERNEGLDEAETEFVE
jgi:hypothetical protein